MELCKYKAIVQYLLQSISVNWIVLCVYSLIQSYFFLLVLINISWSERLSFQLQLIWWCISCTDTLTLWKYFYLHIHRYSSRHQTCHVFKVHSSGDSIALKAVHRSNFCDAGPRIWAHSKVAWMGWTTSNTSLAYKY